MLSTMLPIRNVTYAYCYLYKMLPRQSVLYAMLLYENVLFRFNNVVVKQFENITKECVSFKL